MELTVEQKRALAMAAARKRMQEASGSSTLTDEDKTSPIPDGMIDVGKKMIQVGRKEQEQTFSGAGTTWLEHAISDLPIVGPAIQTGSDYLGTEVLGRLTGKDPAEMREEIWARREGRDELYPASAVSGALAGNLAAFGAAGTTETGARALGMAGERLLPRVINSATSSGSISAADTAVRGGSGEDIINSGVIGAGLGGLIPAVGAGVSASVRALGDRIAPFMGAVRDASKEAGRRVGVAIARDKAADPTALLNATDEAVARDAGVPLLNVDRGGETTRALARSAANQSPEARAAIENAANDRFSGQSQRASEFIRSITGGAVDDIGYQQAIRDTARMVNKPAYDKAMNSPNAQAMWHEGFEQLMKAPAMQQAAKDATTRGANRAAVEGFTPVKNPFVFGPNGRVTLAVGEDGKRAVPNLAFWDQVKRNLDGMIGTAQRAGDNTLTADLTALKGYLVSMADNAVPEYKAARQGAASFFGAEDAIEAGKKFAASPKLVPEARRAYAQFKEPEKAAFATGYASELIDRIRASGDRQNVITQVFKSQASRDSMELVFGPMKMRRIEAYVRVEDLADRLRGAMGNSTTARQLVELGIGAGGGYAVSGGDWKGAAAGALAAKGARHINMRVNDKVMQRIAKILTSTDPKALDSLVANAAMSPKYMRALEDFGSLLAIPARAGAVQAQ